MSTPNNTINDGSVLYGSIPVTVGGQLYDTNDFSLDPEIERFVRKSSNNIPNGKVVIQGEFTGSATLEYPASNINAPVFGNSFSATVNGITYACTIEKVGHKRTMAGQAKIPITFSVNLGTVVASVAT